MQLAGEAKIEVGKVDEDSGVRFARIDLPQQAPVFAINVRQVADDFREAQYGDFVRIDDGVATSLAHATASDAEKVSAGRAMAQGFDQFGAVVLP